MKNSKLWDHQYWDDVSLALLLKSLNIDLISKKIRYTGNPYKQDIDSNYHFRQNYNHFGYPILEIYVLKHLINYFLKRKIQKF